MTREISVDACAVALLLLAMAVPTAAQHVRKPPNVRSATTPSGSPRHCSHFQARGLRIVFSSNIVTSDMRASDSSRVPGRRGLNSTKSWHRMDS